MNVHHIHKWNLCWKFCLESTSLWVFVYDAMSLRGKHSSHCSCFCVSKNWLWTLDWLKQSGPKLFISVLFSISYRYRDITMSILRQLCLTQLTATVPVIALNIFQTIVTSITSIRWWKWFMETGQIIMLTGQLQLHGGPCYYQICTRKHPAPFPILNMHIHTLTGQCFVCGHPLYMSM